MREIPSVTREILILTHSVHGNTLALARVCGRWVAGMAEKP